MFNAQPFQPGQEVFLKRPIQIYARVIGPCDGDWGLPDGQAPYTVELLPLEQYYLPEDLELAGQLHQLKSRPEETKSETAKEPSPTSERAPTPSAVDSFGDLARETAGLIAVRAYEIYESRGSVHGHDKEDWLLAVSEILQNVPAEIAETDTHLTIRAEVPGYTERELQVRVVPRSVCITGKRREAFGLEEEVSADSERGPARIFCVFDLPSEVDPARVEASAGGGVLEISLVKMGSRKVVPVRAKAATA